MKRFIYLFLVLNAIRDMIAWILNKVLTLVYLCLPVGLFLLLMQLRDKNNKATAIGAFVDENSEFQYIFPEYILVSVDPNKLKRDTRRKISNVNSFMEKWKWTLLIGLLGLILIAIGLKFFI